MTIEEWFFRLMWMLSRKSRIGSANYLYTWVREYVYDGTITFKDLVGEK